MSKAELIGPLTLNEPLNEAHRLQRCAGRVAGREEAARLLERAAGLYDFLLCDLEAPELVKRTLRLQKESCLKAVAQLSGGEAEGMALARSPSGPDATSDKLRQAIFTQIDEQDTLLAELDPMSSQKVLRNQETINAIRACNKELKKLFRTLIQESDAKDRLIADLKSRLEALEKTPKSSPIPKAELPGRFQPKSESLLADPLEFEPLALPTGP